MRSISSFWMTTVPLVLQPGNSEGGYAENAFITAGCGNRVVKWLAAKKAYCQQILQPPSKS